jgi:hypothetical protein
MLALMATLQIQGGPPREAEIELDFVSKGWTIKNARYLWPGVLFSEHGTFERQPWGVIWLMDGPGAAATRTPVIIHDAPLNDTDGAHLLGGGRVYDPLNPSLKDSRLTWKFLRRSTTPSAPSGGLSAVRQRILQVCAEIFPQKTSGLIHFTSQRRQPGSKVTNCGAFPGMVFGRVPVIPPTKRGAFHVKDMYLTTPMTMWDIFAQTVDKEKHPPKNTWIPFNGNRPQPGDIYILKNIATEQFQHVGIIVNPDGNEWITADGGQGDGYQGGFVKRTFSPSGEMTGEFGNKARLKGWVDLDNLYAVAKESFPKDLG